MHPQRGSLFLFTFFLIVYRRNKFDNSHVALMEKKPRSVCPPHDDDDDDDNNNLSSVYTKNTCLYYYRIIINDNFHLYSHNVCVCVRFKAGGTHNKK